MLCALAGALPAAASAAPSWHLLPSPPALDSIATGGGHTYVAYPSAGHVRVDQLTAIGWRHLGGLVRHDSTRVARGVQVTVAGDGHPWIVWVEETAGGAGRVRVARYGDGGWVEVAAGDAAVNPSGTDRALAPQLAFAAGRPVVGWFSAPLDRPSLSIEFSRLSDAGTWRPLGGAWSKDGTDFQLVTAGGRLYASIAPGGGNRGIVLFRSTDDGRALEHYGPVIDRAQVVDLADIAGGLGVLYTDDTDGTQRVARADATGALTNIGSELPFRAQSLAEVSGVPYVAGGAEGRQILVARLSDEAWEQLPVADGSTDLDVPVHLLAVGGEPWVSYGIRPEGSREPRLAGFAETPPVLPAPETGVCGLISRGGPGGDLLAGTNARDELFGLGGDDRLFGRAGNDCLHGGGGSDAVHGGTGADFLWGDGGDDRLQGGQGRDVIHGGRGADRIFPGSGVDDVDAGAGNDRVYAAGGGVDHVNCGSGRDVLYASGSDGSRNCERIVRVRPARRR